MNQLIVLWEAWASSLVNKALIHCWENISSQCNKLLVCISVLNANQVVWVGSVLWKVADLKRGGRFLSCVLYFWNSGLGVCFLYSPPSPSWALIIKKDFKVQVVHSHHNSISSLSGREDYNQVHNANSSSLHVCFMYAYFKIIVLIRKRNLQESTMQSSISCCAVSFPSLLPFPCKEL